MKTIKNLKAAEIRKSILQLAIQGKLVKQDPNDEPASELVKRIYAEKQKLIKEGKIKKDKIESYIFKGDDNCYYEKIGNNDPVKLEDLPFDIPDNWTWIKQKNICWLDNGTRTKGEKLPYLEARVIRRINKPSYLLEGVIIDPSMRVILVDGDNSGEIMIPPYKGYMGSTFKIFSAISEFNYDYLLLIFSLNKDKYKNTKIGAAIPHLNKNLFKESYIAVPPIDEQKRIVEKINSFKPLILQYEFHESKLSKLEQEFQEKLKKSILQYAIEGKLVKQDPNDEPASVLLERIKTEKEKLIKEGKIKRDKKESYIYQGDDKNYYENFLFYYHSFDIPNGWKICKLAEISEFIHRGKSPIYSLIEEIPVIAQKCNQKDGSLSLEKAMFIEPSSLRKYDNTKILKTNDIIVNSTGTGTVGRVNILESSLFEKYNTIVTDSHITTIRLLENECNPYYIYFYLKSPLIYDHAEERSEGSTNQIELYAKTIMNYYLCLPPKEEQSRIVSKITRLLYYI